MHHHSIQTAFRMVTGLALAFLLQAQAWAANPDPCDEDYTCYPQLAIDGTLIGDNIVCWGTAGYWTLEDVVTEPLKSKCGNSPIPVAYSVEWSWTISGPESFEGTGKTATYTPHQCGEYTIQFTALGKVGNSDNPPCSDASNVFTKSFNVPTPPIETSIESPTLCPGDLKTTHWKITNTSDECGYNYFYYVTEGAGDPAAHAFGGGDTVYIGPGDTQEGDGTVSVDQTSARGVKNFNWYVFAPCEQSTAVPWTITVSAPAASITIASTSACPTDQVYLHWAVTNTGTCHETYNYVAALGLGDADMTLLPDPANTGTFELDPGGIFDGVSGVVVNPGACGERAINVTIYAEGMEPVSDDGTVSVNDPKLTASGEDFTLCPGERQAFGVIIHNNGECTEKYSYTLKATGDPTILFAGNGSGSGVIAPGGDPDSGPLIRTHADPLTKSGMKTVTAALTTRCGVENQEVAHITVPAASAEVSLAGDPSCAPKPFTLTATIKNTGYCKTTYAWTLKKTNGNLNVTIGKPSGTVTLLPQASKTVKIPVAFADGSPDQGFAEFTFSATAPAMPDPAESTVSITANPSQQIEVVGRSWIRTPVYSEWNRFPRDFGYGDFTHVPPRWVYGTHNPQAYAAFLLGLEFLPNAGGTPDKDGQYRMWSKVRLVGCCDNGKIQNLKIDLKDSDAGTEAGFPGTADFGPTVLERVNDHTYKFSYEIHGHPNPAAEFGIQLVRSRTSVDIWHWIKGTITCGSDNVLHANLALFGSNFPTHELFIDGSAAGIMNQGPITNLWIPLPSDPDRVNGTEPRRP